MLHKPLPRRGFPSMRASRRDSPRALAAPNLRHWCAAFYAAFGCWVACRLGEMIVGRL
jgi:hypothetical protein